MTNIDTLSTDVLIIGSGAAGLSLALRLADRHQVVVLSKGLLSDGATAYAQGGIAAVFDKTDSIEAHIDDTLVAGDGLCNRDAVAFVANNAHHCVQWLVDQNVTFDREMQPDGTTGFHLTREGGHCHRRVVHAADATGKALSTTLIDNARHHPGVRLFEHVHAIDVILSDRAGLPGLRRAVGLWI